MYAFTDIDLVVGAEGADEELSGAVAADDDQVGPAVLNGEVVVVETDDRMLGVGVELPLLAVTSGLEIELFCIFSS